MDLSRKKLKDTIESLKHQNHQLFVDQSIQEHVINELAKENHELRSKISEDGRVPMGHTFAKTFRE